jgi:hypothetical protein
MGHQASINSSCGKVHEELQKGLVKLRYFTTVRVSLRTENSPKHQTSGILKILSALFNIRAETLIWTSTHIYTCMWMCTGCKKISTTVRKKHTFRQNSNIVYNHDLKVEIL